MSEPDDTADDRITLSKREYLALLGIGGAGIAGYASARTGDLSGDLLVGGLDAPLTQQYRKGRYVTAPAASFDSDDLQTGELAWLTDTGQIGVIDEDGDIGTPPIGSSEAPVPAVTTEETKSDRAVIRFDPAEDDLQSVIDASPEHTRIVGHKETDVSVTDTITANTDGLSIESISLVAANGLDDDILRTTGDGVIISDVSIDGNNANNTEGHALRFTSPAPGSVVKHVTIVDPTRDGVNYDGGENLTFIDVFVNDTSEGENRVTSTVDGFDGTVTDSVFIGCEAHGNPDSGFELDDACENVSYFKCRATNNQTGFECHNHLVNGVGNKDIDYISCVTENNQNEGLSVRTTSDGDVAATNVHIIGGAFKNEDSDGLRISDVDTLHVDTKSVDNGRFGCWIHGESKNVNVDGIYRDNPNDGLRVSEDVDTVRISGDYIGNGGFGVSVMDSPAHVRFIDINSRLNGRHGVWVNGGEWVTILASLIGDNDEDNGGYADLLIDSSNEPGRVADTTFHGDSDTAVEIDTGVEDWVIEYNDFRPFSGTTAIDDNGTGTSTTGNHGN